MKAIQSFFGSKWTQALIALLIVFYVGATQHHDGYESGIKASNKLDDSTYNAASRSATTLEIVEEDEEFYAKIGFVGTDGNSNSAKLYLYKVTQESGVSLSESSNWERFSMVTAWGSKYDDEWTTSIHIPEPNMYGQTTYILSCIQPSKCPNLTSVVTLNGEKPLGYRPTPEPTSTPVPPTTTSSITIMSPTPIPTEN